MTEEKSIMDKAKDLATDVKDKVTEMVGDNEEKITGAIDKAGEFVDDKTKHKYHEKIDKAQEAAKNAVTKIVGTDAEPTPADTDTPGAAPAADAPAAADAADTPSADETPAPKPPATTKDDPTPDA